MDLKTGDTKLIADDPRTDVGGVLVHPTEKNIQAVSFTYARTEWKILDPAIAADIEFLKKFQDGDFIVTSRTLDDKQWTVAYMLDNGPVKFYRYIRTPERKMVFLFNNRDDLGDYPLVKMHDRVIKSRDGLDLVCYLSLPPGSDPDDDGMPESSAADGARRARRTVGPRQLGLQRLPPVAGQPRLRRAQRQLPRLDRLRQRIHQRRQRRVVRQDARRPARRREVGRRQQDRRARQGRHHGRQLRRLRHARRHDLHARVFACGVDIVGPSSLVTLLQQRARLLDAVHARDESPRRRRRHGRRPRRAAQALAAHATSTRSSGRCSSARAKTIRASKQHEADQIVKAMTDKNIPVTYVLYPDEGHGFHRPENNKSFNAVTEAFLAEQLGGRFEPVGNDFKGATITVPAGAEHVPGLTEALASIPKPEAKSDAEKTSEK